MIEFRQKEFASTTGNQLMGFGKIVSGLAKDRGVGKMVAGSIVGGITGAGISYGVNKALYHDAKKSGMMRDEDVPQETKKSRIKHGVLAGAGLAAAGTLAVGAKRGWLPQGMSKHINTATGYVKDAALSPFTNVGDDGKRKFSPLGTAWTVGTAAAMPVIGHVMRRKAMKDQVEEQQREYSFNASQFGKSVGGFFKGAGNSVMKAVKNPKQTGKYIGNSIMNMKTNGAWGGTKRLSNDLYQSGVKNNNKIAKNLGSFMYRNDGLVKVAAVPVGIGVIKAGQVLSQKADSATRKTLQAVDKNAYAYDRTLQQQVE